MKKIVFLTLCALLLLSAVSQNIIIRNPGCSAFDEAGICVRCGPRFYRDSNGICQPVNPNCKTYSQITGDCLSCYPGFGLIQGTCLPGYNSQSVLDPNCNTFQDNVCVKCSYRYYFNPNGVCTKADPSCQTFNETNGDCTSCYVGFVLSSGKCLVEARKNNDLNCNQFDSNGVCIKCSYGYYLKQWVCTKIDDTCKQFDQVRGVCTNCYPGYSLNSNNVCVRDDSKQTTDPNCNQFDSNGVCIKCSSGYYFKQSVCTKIDDSCKQFDVNRGVCTNCYPGYSLNSNNVCVKDEVKQTADPNCAQWNNNVCLTCSKGSTFNKLGVCTLLDSNCKSYNSQGGCSSCYAGYDLSNAKCAKSVIQSVTDPNCNEFDSNGQCIKCSTGYYFNDLLICTQIDESCKVFSIANRKCLQCYNGYQLSLTNKCVKVVQNITDPNCAQWNGKICTKCSVGSVFNNQGVCALLDAFCKKFDQTTKICKLCYAGYQLNASNICVQSTVQAVKDLLCAEWNGNVCSQCSTGSYYNSATKLCTLVDPSCKTYNRTTGQCLSCYDGYQLDSNKKCVKSVQNVTDPNCAEWNNKVCTKCSFGASFNNKGVCVVLDPQCKQYNQITNVCKSCYVGYQLNNLNVCTKSAVQNVKDPNCAEWSGDVCVRCSQGSYFGLNKLCILLDSSCKSANQITGQCLECYDGYQLNSSKVCVRVVQQVSDLNCAEWKGKICMKCSFGAVFNNLGKCVILDTQCKQYDQLTGICKGCYQGYDLNSLKVCTKSAIQSITDLLCAEWVGKICTKCSPGSFFNSNGLCTQIDPSCRAANPLNGACIGCYDGYQLSLSGICQKVVEQVSDVNCAQWVGRVCKKCSFGSAFNNQERCTILDSQCKQYDSLTSVCKVCYQGYQLDNSKRCVKSADQAVKDSLCAEWVFNVCSKCSQGSYYSSETKLCTLIDTSCKQSNKLTGQCLSCYDGYQLNQNKKCVKSVESVSDVNCAQWNGKVCIKCSVGAGFNNQGLCVLLDPQCKQYNKVTSVCLGCYVGYELNNSNVCVKSAVQNVRDVLCAEWVGDFCVRCSTGSYLNKSGVCTQVDSQCQSFNKLNGDCLSCYSGYSLSLDSKCIKSTEDHIGNPLCAQWKENKCIKCSPGSYFNGFGFCQAINVLCKTANLLSGSCTSCFDGYKLSGSGCIVSQQDSRDSLCAQFQGLICKKCSFGAYFNSKGVCQLADSLCQSFNKTSGVCLSCYPGHILISGKCQVDKSYSLSDPFCASFQDGICLKCANGYYFQKDGKCTAVDTLCKTYNLTNGKCLSCYDGFELQSGFCIKEKQAAKDPNCASFKNNICVECSKGFIFNQNNICVLINPLCKTFNSTNGFCTSCYTGYVVSGTTCAVDNSVTSSNCAQFIDGICIRCASRTFMNSKGDCQRVSQDCRTYSDFDGQCLSCYSGFSLSKGKCNKQQAKGGCSQSDSNGNCVKCANGFYINGTKCIQIDALCAKFNLVTKVCEGCYSGYTLLEGRCQISKVNQQFQVKNCVAYNTDYRCIQCFDRFYLSNNQCKQVNVFCKTYDLITGLCTGCYSTFKLNNGQCKQ